MTIEQLADLTNARRSGRGYRAKCPVHGSRGLTLAIYQDAGKIDLWCHAGCSKDVVLAKLGLTWKDLRPQREWLPPAEYRRQQQEKREMDKMMYRWRIRQWIDRFRERGYTAEQYRGDMALAAYAAVKLADKGDDRLYETMEGAMERITAASIAGLLPCG